MLQAHFGTSQPTVYVLHEFHVVTLELTATPRFHCSFASMVTACLVLTLSLFSSIPQMGTLPQSLLQSPALIAFSLASTGTAKPTPNGTNLSGDDGDDSAVIEGLC
ncbi:hypothetical protein BHE74_00007412 [Ensete ventricosum]|nr:hypothetical protein GW17_00021195 [Ensete ventricosum]RWW84034.1 hypothetical protein BHE74_00007412 [Ensete ventricosum]RZS23524.1 hypothetical protein BHM03_00056481 [Ensete ventricosum]